MSLRGLYMLGMVLILAITTAVHLSVGVGTMPDTLSALISMNAETYEQAIVIYQRLPRALIAIYVGAVMATSGMVLQGLIKNPVASPSTLGVTSGAALFVVAGAFMFGLGAAAQGAAALAGAFFGFLSCLAVARVAGRQNDPRGLALVLSGALVSMLFAGITNALLLSDPSQRSHFLSWVTGNINHVYIDRLYMFWWIGTLAITVNAFLARPLTLIMLGEEKAVSLGVNAMAVSWLAIAAAIVAAGSAVAICGPIGFIGLIVPHIVRPFASNTMQYALPASAVTGATLCLLADLTAKHVFTPYTLNTGLMLELMGGLMFIVIVKKFYLSPKMERAT